MKFDALIIELISLLERSSEDHWVEYFKKVLELNNEGRVRQSYKATLNAYGGMCSFNDLTLNFISNEEIERVLTIRDELYRFCKSKQRGPYGIFGYTT